VALEIVDVVTLEPLHSAVLKLDHFLPGETFGAK